MPRPSSSKVAKPTKANKNKNSSTRKSPKVSARLKTNCNDTNNSRYRECRGRGQDNDDKTSDRNEKDNKDSGHHSCDYDDTKINDGSEAQVNSTSNTNFPESSKEILNPKESSADVLTLSATNTSVEIALSPTATYKTSNNGDHSEDAAHCSHSPTKDQSGHLTDSEDTDQIFTSGAEVTDTQGQLSPGKDNEIVRERAEQPDETTEVVGKACTSHPSNNSYTPLDSPIPDRDASNSFLRHRRNVDLAPPDSGNSSSSSRQVSDFSIDFILRIASSSASPQTRERSPKRSYPVSEKSNGDLTPKTGLNVPEQQQWDYSEAPGNSRAETIPKGSHVAELPVKITANISSHINTELACHSEDENIDSAKNLQGVEQGLPLQGSSRRPPPTRKEHCYGRKRSLPEEQDKSCESGEEGERQPSSPAPEKTKRKMKRTIYPKEHLAKLNFHFKSNPYMSSEKIEEIAQEMGYSEKQIKVWFQNRRAATTGTRQPKRKALEEEEFGPLQQDQFNASAQLFQNTPQLPTPQKRAIFNTDMMPHQNESFSTNHNLFQNPPQLPTPQKTAIFNTGMMPHQNESFSTNHILNLIPKEENQHISPTPLLNACPVFLERPLLQNYRPASVNEAPGNGLYENNPYLSAAHNTPTLSGFLGPQFALSPLITPYPPPLYPPTLPVPGVGLPRRYPYPEAIHLLRGSPMSGHSSSSASPFAEYERPPAGTYLQRVPLPQRYEAMLPSHLYSPSLNVRSQGHYFSTTPTSLLTTTSSFSPAVTFTYSSLSSVPPQLTTAPSRVEENSNNSVYLRDFTIDVKQEPEEQKTSEHLVLD